MIRLHVSMHGVHAQGCSAPLLSDPQQEEQRDREKKNQRPKGPTKLLPENLMSSIRKPSKVQLLRFGNTEIHNDKALMQSMCAFSCPALHWKSIDNYWFCYSLSLCLN